MRFWTGLLLGLLLAGPTVEHHYHVTETNRMRFEQPAGQADVYQVQAPWQDVEGSEHCVIELLGGPTAVWDADDVIAVLDEAWEAGVSPCEMLE